MLRHRLLYGATLLGIFLAVAWIDRQTQSRVATSVLIAGISLAALFELYDLFRRAGHPVAWRTGMTVAAGFFAACLALPGSVLPAGLALVAAAGAPVFVAPRGAVEDRLARAVPTAFGILYVSIPSAFYFELVRIPGPPDGMRLFLYTVLVVKATDTGAYFCGRAIGRRPLTRLSPKKTWEGAVGGTAAGLLAAGLLASFLLGEPAVRLPAWIGLGLALAVAGQLGDLVESAVKRGLGAKDSGRWLPGLGGILDTIDSLIPVAPVFLVFHRLLIPAV